MARDYGKGVVFVSDGMGRREIEGHLDMMHRPAMTYEPYPHPQMTKGMHGPSIDKMPELGERQAHPDLRLMAEGRPQSMSTYKSAEAREDMLIMQKKGFV